MFMWIFSFGFKFIIFLGYKFSSLDYFDQNWTCICNTIHAKFNERRKY